jgi:hypothetical protein
MKPPLPLEAVRIKQGRAVEIVVFSKNHVYLM